MLTSSRSQPARPDVSVSILVPLYNKEATVVRSIRSALDQSHTDLEVLVVDDGSDDGSLAAVTEIDDPRLFVRSRPNRGANATRNELLAWASGDYVQYLDADDILHHDKIETQIRLFGPEVDVVLSDVCKLRPDGTRQLLGCPGPGRLVEFAARHGVHTLSPLHRRQSLVDIGGWREDLEAAQEYELHLRLALSGAWDRSAIHRQPLATYVETSHSTSSCERRVYRAKARALAPLLRHADDDHRPPLAAALANAARHLERHGLSRVARAHLGHALGGSRTGALASFSWKTRWLRRPALLLAIDRAPRLVRSVRARLDGGSTAAIDKQRGPGATDHSEVLICARHFPPAYRSGGPPRSLGGLVTSLGGHFRFTVLTMANDRHGTDVMPGIEADVWRRWNAADVRYCSSQLRLASALLRTMRAPGDRVLYVNSFFDPVFGLLPILLRRSVGRRHPIVVAPRGEFGSGALALKPRRKWVYLRLLRRSGLLDPVLWQASSEEELSDIRRRIGATARIVVARNLREPPAGDVGPRRRRERRELRLVFLSRIARMKNLRALIEALPLAGDGCRLTIAGPVADADYWAECRRVADDLGVSARIDHVGEVLPDEIVPFLSGHDLFVLPTLGENFGHVILESLLAGTPVIISDRTPWSTVAERGAGLVVDLDDPHAIAAAIERVAGLHDEAYLDMCARARRFGRSSLHDPEATSANIELFRLAAGVAAPSPAAVHPTDDPTGHPAPLEPSSRRPARERASVA